MEYLLIKFALIHLIVGGVRGFYRYRMIEKYQYNYYDQSIKLTGKLAHNLLYCIVNSTTLFISVCLTILLFISSLR